MIINTAHFLRALRPGLVALVVASVVSGCTGISNLYESLEGGMSGEKVRTVPRGGMTELGPKRMPIHNPAGGRLAAQHPQMSPSDYYAAQSQAVAQIAPPQPIQAHPAYYEDPYQGQPAPSNFFERNVSSLMGEGPAADGPRKMPAENQAYIASMTVEPSAPVVAMQKELGMGAYQGQITPVASAPGPVAETPISSDASIASSAWVAGSDEDYPDLRAVPEAPDVTPSSEHRHAVDALEKERMVAERARQAFMSEGDIAPSEMLTAMASSERPSEDDGFGAWLNDLFESGETESQQTATALPVAPSVAPRPLMEPAGMMPLEPSSARVPMESIAVAAAPEPMPAHLPHIPEFDNEPSPYDQRVFNSDDVVPWGARGGPVTLKAPTLSPQQVYTLPESRYAGRRAAGRSASSAR